MLHMYILRFETFLSTPSARRATPTGFLFRLLLRYFYPRPPRGGRLQRQYVHQELRDFYPRPPRGGRPGNSQKGTVSHRFLSTPSARRATRPRIVFAHESFISIHALREEGDLQTCQTRKVQRISIHALREEGDCVQGIHQAVMQNFYPRPPRGGRQQKQRQNLYFQTNYTTFCTNLEEP